MSEAARLERAQPAPRLLPEVEAEIEHLLEGGVKANAWRPEFESFRRQRLWDEQHHGRRVRTVHREWRHLPGNLVLDVGCGRGGMAVALWQQGYRVVGVDVRFSCSRVTHLRGRRYDLDVPTVCARGERLPFADESFNAAACRDVLEHCRYPGQLLTELWRVLRPGGSCFITVINRWCWEDPHYHLPAIAFLPRSMAERTIAWLGRAKESKGDNQRLSQMHYYAYEEFVRWAGDFGFIVRDLESERLRRYRSHGLGNGWRWLRNEVLRPLSLQADQFELLLEKPTRKKQRERP